MPRPPRRLARQCEAAGVGAAVLPARRCCSRSCKTLEVEIDHRRQVQRQKLRGHQAADDREPERPPRLGARADAERDRQRAHQRGERRHHDRAKANDAGVDDRVLGVLAFALLFEREVDHHDRVLLDDADQHDQADAAVEIELLAEHDQRQQRAEHRGRQARKNRQRMDEALVEDAEHEIDHEDREQQQHAHALHGILERLRGALERGRNRVRHLEVAHGVLDAARSPR